MHYHLHPDELLLREAPRQVGVLLVGHRAVAKHDAVHDLLPAHGEYWERVEGHEWALS